MLAPLLLAYGNKSDISNNTRTGHVQDWETNSGSRVLYCALIFLAPSFKKMDQVALCSSFSVRELQDFKAQFKLLCALTELR